MNVKEVHKYREEKEHLMRHEGTHPANQRNDIKKSQYEANEGVDQNSHGAELQ